MKKCLKVLSAVLAVSLLSVSLAACNGKPQDDGAKDSGNTKDPEAVVNANIKFFQGWEPTKEMKAAAEKWKEKYQGQVEFIVVPYEQRHTKLVASINSGDAPDVVSIHQSDIPSKVIKKMFQPIDEYINLDHGVFSKSTMDTTFKWDGKYYAALGQQSNPVFLYFNKTMFKNNGVKTPLEYYEEGKWDWNTFRDVCKELTQDTNSDGKTDVYGYAGWIDELFPISNGVDYVKESGNGNVELNTSDPKFVQAAQFYYELANVEKAVYPDHWGWMEGFTGKKVAMMSEKEHIGAMIKEQGFDDEWDIAPFPKAPGAEKPVYLGQYAGWGLSEGAENPKGGMQFVEFMIKDIQEEAKKNPNPAYSEEQRARMAEWGKNIMVCKANSYGKLFELSVEFWREIREGVPVGTVTAKYDPIFKAEINSVFAKSE